MIRTLFLFIAIYFGLEAKGQVASALFDNYPDSIKAEIKISGGIDYNSNAIINPFIHSVYKGEFIQDQLKDQVLGKLKKQNRFGEDLDYGIHYTSGPKKNNMQFFISVKNRELFNTQFSKDLFKLVMYGNRSFAGETADMNNFNINFLKYQELQFGIIKRTRVGARDRGILFGVGVSILKGERAISINAPKAELYTSSDGQYIDFKNAIIYNRTDTLHKGIGAFNGMGTAIELFAKINYTVKNKPGKLLIELKDVGVLFWKANSLGNQHDTTYHFEGVQVNNIFNLHSSTFGATSKDVGSPGTELEFAL